MRFVVLRTDRLGELLLTLPLVSALRRAIPESHVTVVAQSRYADMLRLHPDVSDVIAVTWASRRVRWRDAWPLIRALRRGHFDAAIAANPHRWLHWAVWRAGIPRRIGYDRKWDWCLTDRIADVKAQGMRHEIEWNLDLIKPLGIAVARPMLALPVAESAKREVRTRLSQAGVSWTAPVVALHPWASAPAKRWPAGAFRSVAQALTAEGCSVVIIGGPEHAREAHGWCDGVSAVNLVGALTLVELAAALSQCALLISNDSGPAHVAAAVGTPTITLFGSPHPWQGPIRWRPWGDGHVVLHQVPIEAIRVEDVMAVIRERVALCVR